MASTAYVVLHTLTAGHTDTVNTIAFSPDGKHLASGGDDRHVIVWNTASGTLLYRATFDSEVDTLIWHPTHPDTIIIGCANGSVHLLNGFTPVSSVSQCSAVLDTNGLRWAAKRTSCISE